MEYVNADELSELNRGLRKVYLSGALKYFNMDDVESQKVYTIITDRDVVIPDVFESLVDGVVYNALVLGWMDQTVKVLTKDQAREYLK